MRGEREVSFLSRATCLRSEFSHYFALSIVFPPWSLQNRNIYGGENDWFEFLVYKGSELIRLLFFLALETVIIMTILLCNREVGELIQRGKGALKITDIQGRRSRNFEKYKIC